MDTDLTFETLLGPPHPGRETELPEGQISVPHATGTKPWFLGKEDPMKALHRTVSDRYMRRVITQFSMTFQRALLNLAR